VQRTLKIFFHDNCFDGTASAAVFSDFYSKHVAPGADIRYQGVQHSNGDPFHGLQVDGDDNACLDFRYDERMNWWFDHHESAFQPPTRRAHFEADTSGRKFFDPRAQSCTKFLARTLSERYGYQVPERLNEVIEWADVIDSAGFASPRDAVALDRPATQLMTWIRYNKDPELTHRYIGELRDKTLTELSREEWLSQSLAGCVEVHHKLMELIPRRSIFERGVVSVDLADDAVPGYNSFISYYLFPDARYTVGLVCSDSYARISVGHNPWSREGRVHNIAALCEKYGGGGHASVAGISLPASELPRAREIAGFIRTELMMP
jgi:hypothetical protein